MLQALVVVAAVADPLFRAYVQSLLFSHCGVLLLRLQPRPRRRPLLLRAAAAAVHQLAQHQQQQQAQRTRTGLALARHSLKHLLYHHHIPHHRIVLLLPHLPIFISTCLSLLLLDLQLLLQHLLVAPLSLGVAASIMQLQPCLLHPLPLRFVILHYLCLLHVLLQ